MKLDENGKPIVKETEDEEQKLLDELENVRKEEEAAAAAKEAEEQAEEQNIVDVFLSGDMDAVKAKIHDKVVSNVSTVINEPEVSKED